MAFKYKRAPAIIRTIKSVDPVKDIRVRILGKVKEKLNGSILLQDSTGTAEIVMENDIIQSLNQGEQIRVFCRVMQLDNGYELRSELIQDMNNLNAEKYEKFIFS